MPRIETSWNGEHHAVNDAKVRKLYCDRIAQRLTSVSRYEQIGNFTLLDKPFSVENGELTLTLKLRRSAIHEHYAEQIESMYAGRCSVEW